MQNFKKEININKKFIVIFILLNLIITGMYSSYALFEMSVIKNSVVVIRTSNIVMKLTSNDLTNNKTLTLAGNETKKINIKITNESNHDALARLYYIGNTSNIMFMSETDFKDKNKTGIGEINSKQSKELEIIVKNNESNSITIELGAQEGLIGYELELKEGRNSVILKNLSLDEKFKQVFIIRNNSYILEDGIYYLSGKADDDNPATTDDIDFNYVWYSGKLWRVTALYPDGTIKMVTENLITAIYWGASPTISTSDTTSAYSTSWIREWLNQEFLPTLYNYENIIVTNYRWNATTVSTATSKPPETTMVTDSVGILTAYEYYVNYKKLGTNTTASGSSYLNVGYPWWCINPRNESAIHVVTSAGGFDNYGMTKSVGVRPAIVLKSSIELVDGDGSYTNPYRINGDQDFDKTSTTLLNTRQSGEYVKIENDTISDRLFRIVGIENSKTKLVLNDYLRESGSIIKKKFSNDYTYGDGNSDTYWDYYLNNTYLATFDNNILEKGIYYLGEHAVTSSYKTTVCLNVLSDMSISECIQKNTIENPMIVEDTWTGYIGFLRVGEMFSSQPKISSKLDETFSWFVTPRKGSSSWYIYRVATGEIGYFYLLTDSAAARPTIHLKSEVVIKSGSGTEQDPYVVGR